MTWKTEKQEKKKRKQRGLVKTLGAVTAVGSSLGLGSLINTDTSDISQLNNEIINLNQEIEKEKKATKTAENEAKQQREVNIEKHKEKCSKIVSPPT